MGLSLDQAVAFQFGIDFYKESKKKHKSLKLSKLGHNSKLHFYCPYNTLLYLLASACFVCPDVILLSCVFFFFLVNCVCFHLCVLCCNNEIVE